MHTKYQYIFFIQTIDNEIVHDFSFALIEAIKYHKWYYKNRCNYDYVLSHTHKPSNNLIPIGTVEFVQEHLKNFNNVENIKPLNIPEQLLKKEYMKRYWIELNNTEPQQNKTNNKLFVKEKNKIKGELHIISKDSYIPIGNWLISELIDIDSEWRIFVFENEIVGCHFYLGKPTLFPDINLIENMITVFNYKYPYTLDVGISKEKGTFVIECHDFFSCGFYGFNNLKIIPSMFIKTFNMLIKNTK